MGCKAGTWFPILTLALLASPPALAAQDRPATPPIAADHWIYDALDRLSAAGLLDGSWLIGDRPRSEAAVAAALRRAAKQAATTRSRLAPFARAVLDRFREEFPAVDSDSAAGEPVAGDSAAGDSAAGDSAAHGAAAHDSVATRSATRRAPHGDSTTRPSYPGRRQAALGARYGSGGLDDGWASILGGQLTGPLGRRLAFLFQPALSAGSPAGLDYDQQRLVLSGKWGPAWAYVGRERFQLGPAASGGILLSHAVAFDGITLGLDDPIRLPGLARHLGPFLATLLLSRIPEDSLGGSGFLAALRVAFAPHPRLQVGLNRTALVVGEVDGHHIGLTDILFIAAGKHTDGDFENQLASIDLRARVDIAGWPFVAYFELGTEDTAGGYLEDPGLILGLFLPLVPGLPTLGLRYEYAAFGRDALFCGPCAGAPRNWYRHEGRPLEHRDVYASTDGIPFGHPLGGYGHEHRLEVRAWPTSARLRAAAILFAREREPENLLFGRHPGRSRAALLEAAYRFTPNLDLEGAAAGEWGSAGWSEHRLWIGLRGFF